MAELRRVPAITRIAQLELKDERRLVKEGYEILDEKRIRLVAEMRTQLKRLRDWQAMARERQSASLEALRAAIGCHGLEELSVYPALPESGTDLGFTRTRVFGVELLEAQWRESEAHFTEQAVNPSPEARRCAFRHRARLGALVQAAVCSVNLKRLMREYVRTERRARAIENVILPEIERSLRFLDDQLEILDQEEIARVRERAPADRLAS